MEKGELRLTRRPDELDEISKNALLAKQGDLDGLEFMIPFINVLADEQGRRYSWIAMRSGLRIYPEEYASAFVPVMWKMLAQYDGRVSFLTFLGARPGTWRKRALDRAAIDVYRACKNDEDRKLASLESIYAKCGYEAADDIPAHNPESNAMNAELLRVIAESDADDVTKACARLYFEGATMREVAQAVGLSDPKQVQRRLRSLSGVVADWRM